MTLTAPNPNTHPNRFNIGNCWNSRTQEPFGFRLIPKYCSQQYWWWPIMDPADTKCPNKCDWHWSPHSGGQHGRKTYNFFYKACLHCQAQSPSKTRPLGESLHATKPNMLLHFDWMQISRKCNVLVLVDDCSKLVMLFEDDHADAQNTANFLMEWFAIFAVCHNWVTNQWTHFKNEVMKNLQHVLGAQHHFT